MCTVMESLVIDMSYVINVFFIHESHLRTSNDHLSICQNVTIKINENTSLFHYWSLLSAIFSGQDNLSLLSKISILSSPTISPLHLTIDYLKSQPSHFAF